MAFPVVESRNGGTESVATTSHSINMPTGINAGDVLIVVFSIDLTPNITGWDAGWTKLGENVNSTVVKGAVFWKIATGSDTLTITTQSEISSHVSLRISGANFVIGSVTNGSSTNSDPPNLDGVFTKDWLWIATRSGDAAVVATGAPSGYSNLQTQTGASSGASTNTAEKTSTASSENPGTFTSNSEQWVCFTLGVAQFSDIVPTNLISSASNTTDASSFTTASVTPTSNRAQLLSVVSRTNISTDPNQPTVTGNGLTWVAVNTSVFDTGGASRRRITLFRAMGASPSSGTITIDFAGQTQTAASWSLTEFSGVETTGSNGANAIVQSAVNQDTTATVSTLSVALSAFFNNKNATFGVFGNGNPATAVPIAGSGFGILGDERNDTTDSRLTTEWTPYNDTSVDMTYRDTGEIGGVAIELRAARVAALTGTATASITESDIVTGGKTIILTLTNDTWVASGATFDAQRQNIINGIDSAQAEAAGWDAVVKATQGVSGVVRTSDTVVTITLDAQATYNITATETITATIPSTALSSGLAIVATPTFTVTASGGTTTSTTTSTTTTSTSSSTTTTSTSSSTTISTSSSTTTTSTSTSLTTSTSSSSSTTTTSTSTSVTTSTSSSTTTTSTSTSSTTSISTSSSTTTTSTSTSVTTSTSSSTTTTSTSTSITTSTSSSTTTTSTSTSTTTTSTSTSSTTSISTSTTTTSTSSSTTISTSSSTTTTSTSTSTTISTSTSSSTTTTSTSTSLTTSTSSSTTTTSTSTSISTSSSTSSTTTSTSSSSTTTISTSTTTTQSLTTSTTTSTTTTSTSTSITTSTSSSTTTTSTSTSTSITTSTSTTTTSTSTSITTSTSTSSTSTSSSSSSTTSISTSSSTSTVTITTSTSTSSTTSTSTTTTYQFSWSVEDADNEVALAVEDLADDNEFKVEKPVIQ